MKKLFYLILGFTVFSCTDTPKGEEEGLVTPSGIEIIYFEKGKGEKPTAGLLLLFNTRYTTEDDRVLLESNPEKPLVMGYNNETPEEAGLVKEVIDHMTVGDSIYFEIPAKNLYEVSFGMEVPDTINEESNIRFYMKLVDQMDRVAYMEMMSQKSFEANKEYFDKEKAELRDYLKKSDISVDSTESGLYYEVITEGEGESLEVGDRVTVRYKGKLLTGEEFDSGEFTFTLGQGEVIKGWDEGILLLNEGSEAVLYIPSFLGYSSQGTKNIPPFSSLIFEVEVLNVSKVNT